MSACLENSGESQRTAKPKIYQGVKVRMTVKELLEQKRALQAEKNGSKPQQDKMKVSDPIPPSDIYSACEHTTSVHSHQQTRQFPVYGAQEDNLSFLDQLLVDAYLEPDHITDSSISVFQNQYMCFMEEAIQPSPIFQQNMTPESPSDSSDLSNSFEYSPTYQSPEFVPQSYSSPSNQDTRSCAYAGMDHHLYQHQNNATFCYCAYCCSVDYQESVKVQDSCAYTNTDCMGYLASLEDVVTRDLTNYDLCYR